MSDPWTAAWEEAQASVPPTIDVYHTLELQHAAFVEATIPFAVRAVAGDYEDQLFTLEDGATIDGGEEVLFKAIPFYTEFPEVSEGTTPSCKITIDSVGDEIIPYLEAATKVRSDMIAIYRQYRSDDRTAPCYGPVEFRIKQASLKGATIEGVAKIDDLANRKFPSRVYQLTEYPGLVP
jgi:hypothetical protein